MAKIFGWSPTEMREREDAFAARVDKLVMKLGQNAIQIFKANKVIVAAGSKVPAAPVELGELGAITGMWKGFVSAELMPLLSDTYLEAAGVMWQGIDEAFDELVVPEVSDVFAEEYLASASNRLVGIGDHVWLKVREQLLTGFSLGESTTALANRVQAAAQVSQARANVIARTEANMAANAGSFQQVLVSGLTGTKEWLDTNDERTRCTHRAAGGQTVDLRTPFTLGGGDCGESLAYLMVPGDPTAPPSEIIQCRCSVAFDLTLDEETVVTAAGEVNLGGMIALMPTAEDANALALDVDGAEPASELHTTLLFLGEASEWGTANRDLLVRVVTEIVAKYASIGTETFSVNIFNPSTDDFDTAVVLGVRGTDMLVALHKAITLNVADVFDDEVPEQHTPWVPHITLAYSDEMSVVKQAMKKLGPVVFDRVRVVFAGQITDIPLGAEVMTAAGDPDWDESKVKRDSEGKFAKKATEGILAFLKDETDELPFDFEDKNKTPDLDLDAVPPTPASAKGKKGTKVKFSNPDGEPGMLVLAADPGKSGDGYVKKSDGSKGPWGKYGAAGVMLRHRGEDGVDRYLLVARGKKLSQSGKWQLPGGGLDSKETPVQAAAREIVEELGFDPADVAKGRVHGYHEVEVPDTGGWKYTSYAATVPDQLVPDLSGENAKLETGDAQWLTVEEIQALDDNGMLLGPLAGGQWKENIVDLFPPEEKKPEVPGTQAGGVDDIMAGDFSQLKKVSGAKGSNEGGIFMAPDGSLWYVKKQKSAAHARNEKMASDLYRAAGIDVPEVTIGSGTPGLTAGLQTATRIVPEGTAKLSTVVKHLDSDALRAAREGFAVDALLANWDVAGLEFDNIIFDAQGKPHRIDVGGALEFRAQGGKKGDAFGTDVVEWDTLRDPKKNPQSAKLFAGLSDSELAAAVEHVESLTPEKIREIVQNKKLADKLIARRADLLDRAEQEGVLSSVTGDVGFHPVVDHVVDNDPSAATFDDTDLIDDEIDTDVPTYGVVTPFMEKVFADLATGKVGDVLYQSEEDGVITRLAIRTNPYITEPHVRHETSFDGGKTWQSGNVYKTADEMAMAGYFAKNKLSPTDAFKQHMATKTPAPAELTVSGVEHDLSTYKQENIWYAALIDMELQEGDVILKGTSLDVHNNPMRIVVRKDDKGFIQLHEEELDQPTGKWIKGRIWHSEDEFNDADLSEYDVLKGPGKYSATTGTVTPTPPTDYTHPGPFSSTGAPHAKLWNQVGNGKYANGHGVAGGIDPLDGKYHRLVAMDTSNGWVLMEEVSSTPDATDFYPIKTYYSLHEFGQHDFSYMGVGKPMTPPGPVKAVTTPSSVPVTLPKKVPKLTNAIIYGKYQNGEVIATLDVPSGKPSERLVYKNNKIVVQQQSASGDWIDGGSYGKAEAYKKFSGAGSWYLGEMMPSPTKTPIVVTPMTEVTTPTPTPSAPAGTTSHLDLEETIKQGQYQEGDIVATYAKKASSEDVRVIFSKGKFVKQTKSKLASPGASWTSAKTYDDSDALLSSMAKGSGVWTKAGEASGGLKPGAKAPAVVTPKIAASFKKTFDDAGVKWHTSADLMLKALSDALKKHPDFTSAQILAHMDTTTKTKTSPTPFTDKVTKYLKTKNGVAVAKSLGLPVATPKKSTPTYTAPKVTVPTAPVDTGPTITIHDIPHTGPTAPPGTYEIKGVTGMGVIHKKMMAQYGSWTSAQHAALQAYTGSSYVDMNGCLRKKKPCTAHTKKLIADAVDGMRPTTEPFQVTRGAGWSAVGLPSSDTSLTKQQRIKLTQELEGKVMEEPGFFSTSSASTPAFSAKPVHFVVDVPAGVPGAWVHALSVHNNEKEFLLAPGLKYRVKKVTPPASSSSPIIVHLEVIVP